VRPPITGISDVPPKKRSATAAPTRDPVVRRLYEKAKQLGTWDPAQIDLTRDAHDWGGLGDDERDLLLRVTALFHAGEEAVTRDLLPLALAIANERRLDDELFVTAWLWEEGKHADLFARFLAEVVGEDVDLESYEAPLARILFEEHLRTSMNELLVDAGPASQARAITTYCLIVEGVLADTGQHVLAEALETRGLLPGLRAGLRLVNRDEARHVAYGLHVLGRLMQDDISVGAVVGTRVRELAPLATGLADSIILRYETRPFGLSYALREPINRLLAQLTRIQAAAEQAAGLSGASS
jgi:ribonucleoside-diphosphate reductase beta chain